MNIEKGIVVEFNIIDVPESDKSYKARELTILPLNPFIMPFRMVDALMTKEEVASCAAKLKTENRPLIKLGQIEVINLPEFGLTKADVFVNVKRTSLVVNVRVNKDDELSDSPRTVAMEQIQRDGDFVSDLEVLFDYGDMGLMVVDYDDGISDDEVEFREFVESQPK